MKESITTTARHRLLTLEHMVGRRVKGCNEQLRIIIGCLIQGLHVDLLGPPGVGKTLTMLTLRDCLRGATANRIQFTPDLMPADIMGTSLYDERTHSFEIKTGPIVANIVLADEINRTPPRTQSALLEAMQDRTVTITGIVNQTITLPDPFFVIATQNPIEQEGTYPLPEAQEDRFGARVVLPMIFGDDLCDAIAGTAAAEIREVLHINDVPKIRRLIASSVHCSREAVRYAAEIVTNTHPCHNKAMAKFVTTGVSIRAGQAMLKLACYLAFLKGKDHVSGAEIKSVAPCCLRHRLYLLGEHVSGDTSAVADEAIADVLSRQTCVIGLED